MRVALAELIGYLYNLQSDSGRALSEYLLAEAKKSNLALLEIAVLVHSYRFYDFNIQISNLRAAAALARSEELFADLAAAYQFMAVVFRDNAQADSALLYALAAKDLLEEYNPDDDLHHVLQIVADMHFYAGEYDQAADIYKRILNELPKGVKHWRYITLNNNLGLINFAQNRYEQAERYFLLADSILLTGHIRLGDSIGMIYTSRKLMELYIAAGNPVKAQQYCSRGFALTENIREFEELSGLYIGQARIFLLAGKPKDAFPLLQKGEAMEIGKNNISLLQALYEGFADYYRSQGDYPSGSKYLQKLMEINKTRDSLFNRTRILHIYAQHQYKNARQDVVRLERESNLMVLILIVISAGILVFLILYIRINKAHKLLVRKNLEFIHLNTAAPLGVSPGDAEKYPAAEDFDPGSNEETSLEKPVKLSKIEPEVLNRIKTGLETLMVENRIFLDKELNSHSLADKLNTNRTYLYKMVETTFGMSVGDLINGYRIKHAVVLMSSGESAHLGIDGIAEQSGFNNRVTFAAVFKKHTGVSPSVFMKSGVVNTNYGSEKKAV